MGHGREARRRLWPAVDSALSGLGGYAVAAVGRDEYVGTADADMRSVEASLRGVGFGFEVVAALKHRSCPSRRHVEAGSWVLRESPLAENQFHRERGERCMV